MLAYWSVFFVLSYLSVSMSLINLSSARIFSSSLGIAVWGITFLALLFLLGFRHEVGGDWIQYLKMFEEVQYQNEFDTTIIDRLLGDPGYQILMHLSLKLETGIYGVNLLCALIFLSGLFFFASQLPKPMLAIAIAFPYLIVIVGMGYTRQSAAIGLVMSALVYFARKENSKFIILVLMAALFHKSAVILIGLLFFAWPKFSFFRLLMILMFSLLTGAIFIAETIESMFQHYVLEEYNSDGAGIRLLMNALCSLALLIRLDQFNFSDGAKALISMLAKVSIFMFLLFLFFGIGEVVLDRLSLYLIPIQLIFFAGLSKSLNLPRTQILIVDCLILLLYAIIFYVWLNFASHAPFWLPYNNLISEPVITPIIFQ
jgi:hypothetical protein